MLTGLGRRGAGALLLAAALGNGAASAAPLQALQALPTLDVPSYMGLWYQVAWIPNRFQSQCVSDTTATYRLQSGGVEVLNRCRLADGRIDEASGLARATGEIDGDTLTPAQLEVSFLPAWLRWLPLGWGRYWVIQLSPDGRYAVISEPTREYLWVLARQPALSNVDESAIRSKLVEQGFTALEKLQIHRHTAPLR